MFQAKESLDYIIEGRWQNCVPLDRNTYCLDSVADKNTYTYCKRDSLIPAVSGDF